MIELTVRNGRTMRAKSPPDEVFKVLSDIPDSVAHFPGLAGFSRKSAGPLKVSMYWCTTRHMCPHSPPSIHFTPNLLASAYILALSLLAISWEVKKPKLPPSDA